MRHYTSDSYPNKIIFFIRAHGLVDRWCLSYLTFIWDISVDPPPIDSVSVV